ncbi:fatty acid desaturase [Sporichthya polymorpha]|uniref:fatty acid desaturase n=1 Tax=Sporichthya polymorpha TaxID=35751 RepID=UPI00037AB876|nr:fatty acid desaturase [Sporichthya polymorpha]
MTITANPSVRQVLAQVVRDPDYEAIAHRPTWQWPHLALTAGSWALFVGSTWAYLAGNLPLIAMLLLNQLAFYACFTPLHDAVHNAASGNQRVNDWIGTISGTLLLPGVTTAEYRVLHMEHHRWVGDRQRDPDHWFVHAPKPLLPVVFAGPEWVWTYWWLRKLWPTHSLKENLKFVRLLVIYVGMHVGFLASPYWKEFLLCWLIPHWMAFLVLVYVFAHIQHPEESTWQVAPFQSTVELRGTKAGKVYWLGQTDHCIHHALPHVPFHKYHRVWDLSEGILRKQGIPERGLFRGPEPFEIPRRAYDTTVAARVVAARDVAPSVRTFELEGVDGDLPAFTPGAHVDVHLPSGRVRQYSLCGPVGPRYRIAVKALPDGRGGSLEVHETLTVGSVVTVSAPRNNFALVEAQRYDLIAAGIGITPMLSFAHHLHAEGKQFTLHVCASDEASVPFGAELSALPFADAIELHVPGRQFSLERSVGRWAGVSAIYVCGPAGFMDMVGEEAARLDYPIDAVHRESFTAAVIDLTDTKPFEVVLARSGRTFTVPAERQCLDVLLEHDVDVPWSCSQGVCGSCVTPVLEGEVEHRDAVLNAEVKASNCAMTICVSRAKGDRVVLDL